ncbi:conserved hypothetical protein, variant [Coccidioides immitis H538.4]|uniref:BZIP domain-containing protein n=1 Tax=Coccidioides immitis H538.4 TaxID=396776 RepID=A0A0J8RAS4_COCIT|nr:conserved hypothetical protein, variant [Coccidioides immitis H538.4]
MAATGELPMAISALSPAPNYTSCYDTSEMDNYINFEPIYPSPSLSPSAENKSSNPTPSSQPYQHSNAASPSPPSNSNAFGSNAQASQQLSFSAPSHQYGSYQQQTGLPMGGLANTMALNPAPGMSVGFNDPSFGPPDGFGLVNRHGDMFPMNSNSMFSFPNDSTDMDMESDNPAFPQGAMLSSQSSKTQFVDPNAVGGQELSPVAPSTQIGQQGLPSSKGSRDASTQQQQQQQQPLQGQQQQLAQGQPQPQVPHGHSRQPSRSQQGKVNRPVDPLVEERISRLLQQMRQSSVVIREEPSAMSNALPQPVKQKKDEQDMDEDERLLASEEGKKLSSKERRQLRNKVSARAFRSRRKEYIGQLEGEVTAKTNEANDLRLQNRALMEENARLTDLTRMLLSSPHFNSFLNDITVNGLPPSLQKQSSTPQAHAPTDIQNDVKPTPLPQDVQIQNPQTALPSIAEEHFDFASIDSGWNSGIDTNFSNPTVLAVMEVPESPTVDAEVFCGKNNRKPEPGEQHLCPNTPVDVDENDPSLALYLDQPSYEPSDAEPFEDMFGGADLAKVFARFDLVVDSDFADQRSVDPIAVRRFERLRASIEGAYQRVTRVTSHLG